MNIELIEKVIASIEDPKTWFDVRNPLRCVWGHLAVVTDRTELEPYPCDTMAKLLGITKQKACEIYVDGIPGAMRADAVAMLRYLIQTGNVNWRARS